MTSLPPDKPPVEPKHGLAFLLARATLCIVVDGLRDWLDGNPVQPSDFQAQIEIMVRDELELVEKRMREKIRNEFFGAPLGAAQQELFGFKVGRK
jgi:hypothetical protein